MRWQRELRKTRGVKKTPQNKNKNPNIERRLETKGTEYFNKEGLVKKTEEVKLDLITLSKLANTVLVK